MRSKCFKAFTLALLLIGLGGIRANAGYVVRVFYDKLGVQTNYVNLTNSVDGTVTTNVVLVAVRIPGDTVADLLNAKATNVDGQVYNIFPTGLNGDGLNGDGSPFYTEKETQFLEAAATPGTNYGSMIEGYIDPPQTGNYTFWISSHDSSELWLSTDNNPANKQKIAFVDGQTDLRQWNKYANQQSAPVSLAQGQSYYFQVLQKQGATGEGYVSVGWELPDGTMQLPIPSLYLQPYPTSLYGLPDYVIAPLPVPSFIQNLQDVTAQEHSPATFSVSVNGTPVSYQWYRGITPIPDTPIPGAVDSFYTLPFPTLADNGARFRVVVGTAQGMLISSVATLTVTADTTPPTLVSAKASVFDPALVEVTFSEPVTADTASDLANYSLDQGAEIYGIVVDSPTAVTLYTSVLSPDAQYTLTGNGITDLASTPNTMADSKVTFSVAQFLEFKKYNGLAGASINDIAGSANFQLDAFDQVAFVDSFESPWASGQDYIGQIQGILTAPADGDYRFYLYANNAGILYMSADENPANKVAIAAIDSPTDLRQYNKFGLFLAANAEGSDGSGTFAAASAFSYTNIYDVEVSTTNIVTNRAVDAGGTKETNYVTNVVVTLEPETNITASASATNVTSGGSAFTAATGIIRPNANNSAVQIWARVPGDYYNGITVTFVDDVATGLERAVYDAATKTLTIHKNAQTKASKIVTAISLPGQVSDTITLTAGHKYYIEADLKAGGSGMHGIGVAWQQPGQGPVQDGTVAISNAYIGANRTLGPITVTNSPSSMTVLAGQPVTFSVGNAPVGYGPFTAFKTPVGDSGVDGTPPYSYQWYHNGQAISGAVDTTYTLPEATLANNGDVFTVLVKNDFSLAASANATLTVTSAPPTVIASGLFADSVTVLFSVPVNSATATNLANYGLTTADGSAVNILDATVASDGKTVTLQTASLAQQGAYSLGVSNVTDQASPAKVMANTVLSVGIFNFADIVRINNDEPFSLLPGGMTAMIEGGGANIGGTSDQFVYAYQQATGNFDYSLKVQEMDTPDALAKIGIMARLSLDADSPNVYSLVGPPGGVDTYQFQYRDVKGGSTATTGSNPAAGYPSVWIRLQRVGSVFNGFLSTDGQNWTIYASKDTATS
ncbi:MAG: PA14 domain-containing protein, partial [Candidatus Omnitrophica bacterium]|nr:PA14 domain-containing protein [Candidatus Omnitrophota bacterium]